MFSSLRGEEWKWRQLLLFYLPVGGDQAPHVLHALTASCTSLTFKAGFSAGPYLTELSIYLFRNGKITVLTQRVLSSTAFGFDVDWCVLSGERSKEHACERGFLFLAILMGLWEKFNVLLVIFMKFCVGFWNLDICLWSGVTTGRGLNRCSCRTAAVSLCLWCFISGIMCRCRGHQLSKSFLCLILFSIFLFIL